MEPSGQKISKLIYLLPILWAVVIRCSVGLFPHSGEENPPMFGDFEAQRHWMEITVHTPIGKWYTNHSENDLMYWGLDYPPLTAYHSYFLGLITNTVNKTWIELGESHGMEDKNLKALMRAFVLFSDLLTYLPVLFIYYFYTYTKVFERKMDFYVMLCGFFYPGIILIDHGHFQYNCISLGLYMASCLLLLHNRDFSASALFCFALFYKQMELYHSLPVFFLLLGKSLCIRSFRYFTIIAATVIVSFLALMLPILLNADSVTTSTLSVLERVFPVSRGLYEDKVSSVWCALSPLLRFSSRESALAASAACTLLLSLPACLVLLANVRKKHTFLRVSVIVSLTFFLFSYQVHEKSVLLPAASALLLAPLEPFWALSLLHFSSLSMLPLLLFKDNLGPALLACGGLYLLCFAPLVHDHPNRLSRFVFYLLNIGFLVILCAAFLLPPPSRYPHLYPLLLSQWSCAALLLHLAYFYWALFTNL